MCSFSKITDVGPHFKRTDSDVICAFKSIFGEINRKVRLMNTEKGGEFKGKGLAILFLKQETNYVTSDPTLKATVVKHFKRTLMEIIYYHN
jgi:hypothetical protein